MKLAGKILEDFEADGNTVVTPSDEEREAVAADLRRKSMEEMDKKCRGNWIGAVEFCSEL